jgi:hypothetical protein
LPIAVDADFERFIAGRRALLDARLAAVELKAKGGLLPDVSLERGVLKITPIAKSTPPEAEALAARLYTMLPRIRVTDLLRGGKLDAVHRLLHPSAKRRDGCRSAHPDGKPSGRRAQSWPDAYGGSLHNRQPLAQLVAWVADWYIRNETYALALRHLVEHQQREPLAAIFGGGFASSSDGQFFRAGGFGRDAGRVNAHYSDNPGSKFYTHLSDRYASFHTKVIAAKCTV